MSVDWFKSDEMNEFFKRKDLPMLRTWRGFKEFLKHMARNPTLYSENELVFGKQLTAVMLNWYKQHPYANVDPNESTNGLIAIERTRVLKLILFLFMGIDDDEMKECNTDWSRRTWKLD